VLDRETGLLEGPASVDTRAKIFVLAVPPGSWFGAPAFQQSVEVLQHASRAEDARIKSEEDASIQSAVVDAVASVSSAALGLVGGHVLSGRTLCVRARFASVFGACRVPCASFQPRQG
jgi:hypothetical protein